MANNTQYFYGPIDAQNVGIIYQNDRDKSALDLLEPYVNHSAAYNSAEREKEEAIICQPGTRTRVLNQIQGWVRGDGPSIIWLYGPAGAGKSTIAYTIAEQCDKRSPTSLAFSYFFSRRNINRNDLTKFIPTFAHRLVSAIPSLNQWVKEAISSNRSIFSLRLKDQVEKLIIGPLREIRDQIPLMVVVIDGLDEYSDETSKVSLSHLMGILVNALADYPFRFFFASRPEPYIRAIFNELLANIRTMSIPISDWETSEDVYKYLTSELSKVQRKKMLPPLWPSESDVWALVGKSEGIFIYASTLVKHVGEDYCDSMDRLHNAIQSHDGLDSLFAQVFDNAKKHSKFQFVIGIIMFLRNPLSISGLAGLLQHDTYYVRSALAGSASVLFIPEGENDNGPNNYIRPYHASLSDFLTNHRRSKNHFLDPVTNHAALVKACENLVAKDYGLNAASSDYLFYAYRNWCHHTLVILSSENSTNIDRSPLLCASTELAERLYTQDITWLCRMKSHEEVEQWLMELLEAILCAKRGIGQFEAFISVGERLQNVISKFLEIYHKNFDPFSARYLRLGPRGPRLPFYAWDEVCNIIATQFKL